jgi:hypothetical protein
MVIFIVNPIIDDIFVNLLNHKQRKLILKSRIKRTNTIAYMIRYCQEIFIYTTVHICIVIRIYLQFMINITKGLRQSKHIKYIY